MPKNENYYFQGKASWANRLFEADTDYGQWSVKLHFTPKSHEDFLKLKEPDGEWAGILNEVKKDEDGYFHQFRRPVRKEFRDKNNKHQEIEFDPPIVLDSEGRAWDQRVPIGNGSDITVKVELYRYSYKGKKGRAIRLVSVKVDNLVPLEIDKDFSPRQKKQIEGLAEQPPQLF